MDDSLQHSMAKIKNFEKISLLIVQLLALVTKKKKKKITDDIKYIFIINFGFHETEIDIGHRSY